MFNIFGFQYSKEKLEGFSETTELLGVELNLEQISKGLIQVENKKLRVEETVTFLDQRLLEKSLKVGEMPSKLGKLQYAEAGAVPGDLLSPTCVRLWLCRWIKELVPLRNSLGTNLHQESRELCEFPRKDAQSSFTQTDRWNTKMDNRMQTLEGSACFDVDVLRFLELWCHTRFWTREQKMERKNMLLDLLNFTLCWFR